MTAGRAWFVPGIVVLALASCTSGSGADRSGPAASDLPVPTPSPAPTVGPVPDSVISFLRLKVDMNPPTPAPAVSMAAAQATATDWLQTVRAWRPGATVAESLATLTDRGVGIDGTLVWLVAYDGVQMPTAHGPPRPDQGLVIIDATSGERLLWYGFHVPGPRSPW